MPSFSSFNIANEQSCQQTRFVVTWQEGLYFCQEQQENDVLFPQPCFPHYCKMYENHSDSLLSQVSEWSELYFQNYMLPKIKNWKWDFFGHFQTVCIVLNLPWQKKNLLIWVPFHCVSKSQKRSHSTLRAKQATFTTWVDKSSLKMKKMSILRVFENLMLAVK